MKRSILVFALAALLASPAHAQRQLIKGEALLQWAGLKQTAESTPTSGDDGLMLLAGFVYGVHDAFNEIMFCTPPSAEPSRLVEVTHAFLRDHPELAYKSAADLIRQALAQAFPCSR